MDLGIVVLYYLTEQTEPLLPLHLRKIDRNTRVPFAIYGCVTQASAGARTVLETHPRIRLRECPRTDLTGYEEHAHYLDHLVSAAIEEGATHVVTLHVDSFPVRPDWAETLAGRLSDQCPFVTLEGLHTACMMFTREFYLRCRPPFLLSDAETHRPEYRRYLREQNPVRHSGIGYGFRAYLEGLTGSFMRDSTAAAEENPCGRIYDDLVFHLKGAVRIVSRPPDESVLGGSAYAALVTAAATAARAVLPPSVLRAIRRGVGRAIGRLLDEPRRQLRLRRNQKQGRAMLGDLLADPEAVLARLRGRATRD